MASVPELMAACEQAYEDFAKARTRAAEAKANYERARLGALVRSQETSQAARDRDADVQSVDEKCALLDAEALQDVHQTHVRVLLGLLVAAQSMQKFTGQIDGGTDWGPGW